MILMVRQMFVQVLYPMWPAEESRLQNPQGGSLPHSELQSWISIPFHKWQLSVACCIIVIFYSFLHGYMGKLMLWLDLGDAVVAACHLRCLGSNPLSCQHRRWRLLRIKAIIAVICCNTCHCLSLIATAKKGSKPFIVSSQMKAIAKPVCTAKNGKSCCFFKYFFQYHLNLFACCFESQAKSSPWDATEAVAHGLASHEGREPVSSCKWKEESPWISSNCSSHLPPWILMFAWLHLQNSRSFVKTKVIFSWCQSLELPQASLGCLKASGSQQWW